MGKKELDRKRRLAEKQFYQAVTNVLVQVEGGSAKTQSTELSRISASNSRQSALNNTPAVL